MVDSPGAQAELLADLKPATYAEKDVFLWDAHIGKSDMHMAMRRIVMFKNMHRAQDLDSGGVDGDKDLRLLLQGFRVGRGFYHNTYYRTPRSANFLNRDASGTWVSFQRSVHYLEA